MNLTQGRLAGWGRLDTESYRIKRSQWRDEKGNVKGVSFGANDKAPGVPELPHKDGNKKRERRSLER